MNTARSKNSRATRNRVALQRRVRPEMSEVLATLDGKPIEYRVRARKNIEGAEWTFPSGKRLRGIKEKDGTWRVWPFEQEFAYIVGVPDEYISVTKRVAFWPNAPHEPPRT